MTDPRIDWIICAHCNGQRRIVVQDPMTNKQMAYICGRCLGVGEQMHIKPVEPPRR